MSNAISNAISNARIKNALVNSGVVGMRYGTNAPYYSDDKKKYFADNTKAFNLRNLKWTSNMVEAQVQGVDYNNFYEYTSLRLRSAMLIDPTTGLNLGSDFQRIMIEDPNIDFLPRGAKVVFNGNTWLVINPQNVESISGTSVIRRCNATWRHYDYYGNMLSEPFCYGQGGYDLATANDFKKEMVLMSAYQHAIMQLNPDTQGIAHNKRLILGTLAYNVHGVQDYVQEFSEDINSIHIQYFDLYADEPLDIDDMDKRIAGGKTFYWSIDLSGTDTMAVGQEQTISAKSERMEEVPNPGLYDYEWTSSDSTIATVDETGKVKAIANGSVTISCNIVQNRSISQSITIAVTSGTIPGDLAWETEPKDKVEAYSTISFEAKWIQGSAVQPAAIEYEYAGADPESYLTEQTGNVVRLSCKYPVESPLTITAKANGLTLSKQIMLVGW